MTPKSSHLVLCHHKTAAVVAGFPEGPWVPENHLALWYGELDQSGQAVVWTVPCDCCQELQLPMQVRH